MRKLRLGFTRKRDKQPAPLVIGRQDALRRCFLSFRLCKVGIMQTKGKTPKVRAVFATREPMANIPEGRV